MKYTNPIIEIKHFGGETVGTAETQAKVTYSTYAADTMANSMFNGTNKIMKTNMVKVYDVMSFQ